MLYNGVLASVYNKVNQLYITHVLTYSEYEYSDSHIFTIVHMCSPLQDLPPRVPALEVSTEHRVELPLLYTHAYMDLTRLTH